MKRLLPLLIAAVSLACAQYYPNAGGPGGTVGYGSGTTDPATCTPNVTLDFFNTTSQAWKYCSASNTWTAGRSVVGNQVVGTTVLAAICIGTDDTAYLQGLIDTLGPLRGTLVFSPGTNCVYSTSLKLYKVSPYTPYNGLTIYQNGATLKTKAGTSPGHCATVCVYENAFELSNPADVTGANPTADVNIIGPGVIDGNKSNVTIPPGAASDDVTHSGIFCNQCTRVKVSEVTIKNFWFGGLVLGLYTTASTATNVATVNNGYSNVVGYGGVLLQGSSANNTILGHTSNGDVDGLWMLNAVNNNVYSGTITGPTSFGVLFTDSAAAYTSAGNTITATVNAPTGTGAQLGASGASTSQETGNTVNIAVNGNRSAGSNGIYIGKSFRQNTINAVVSDAYTNGIDNFGSENSLTVNVRNSSRAAALGSWAFINESGAVRNNIRGNISNSTFRVTDGSLTSLSVTSNVCTATTGYPHTYTGSGIFITVYGSATSSLNGNTGTGAVTGASTFTFSCTAADGTYTDAAVAVNWARGYQDAAGSGYNNAYLTIDQGISTWFEGGTNNRTEYTGGDGQQYVNGVSILPSTSASLGGSALTAGQCSSTAVTITGLAAGGTVTAVPTTYPGDGFTWEAYASSSNTATIKICAIAAGTPTSSTYVVRANP